MRGAFFDDDGEIVGAVEPDIYFDEKASPDIDKIVIERERFVGMREGIKIVTDSKNRAMEADVLALILAVGFSGCTEQQIADKHGVTRAAISARVAEIRGKLNLFRAFGPARSDDTRRLCVTSRYFASMR